MDKAEKAFMIANNAIYFGDNSDYETALYEICDVLNPDIERGNEYIESVISCMENSNVDKKIVGTADDMFDTHELKIIETEGKDWIILRTFYSRIPYSVVFDSIKDKQNFIDEYCNKWWILLNQNICGKT